MNLQTTTPLTSGWKLFGVIAALILAMSAAILWAHADPVEGVRSLIRATARTSFTLFLIAFTASAFVALVPAPWSKAVLRERRYIGLAFAFSHLVHAIAIYSYGRLAPEFWPGRTGFANVPGSVGYLFIVLMTVTSFKPVARRLSAVAWKRLHTTGMWVIAAVFASSYFKRIPMDSAYAIPFGILLAAIAIRQVGKLAQANKRRQTATRGAAQYPTEAA
ncbi:ferric reductase-like transmembrane domain-containing protein [Lysobacter gummosus]|uniref:Ferric reductase-like transmembrane domain-containing protein n=1 Tax=Lysobacter gummosus TaxID=262324 RepID=A0ABY3X7I4_9GAMM|nr:ferric reductase-like transmembrane domain-containing protein [Lysobacter gummosus]ALN91914.1 ferric reductase like transmembrane component family protein [Lysobacter gummosus]UNP27570.1 ferric reductase-like transmembrane domain-containing protein [Lysobacter gummosus]